MMQAYLEAILFSVAKPFSIKKLADILDVKPPAVEEALITLTKRYASEGSGVRIVRAGNEVQLMTSPESSEIVRSVLDAETTGELTRPQLETLTVIAYREPITKPELEQIRGVNCSLILRNLLMRGLIEMEEPRESFSPTYHVTHDFLRFLGISQVEALPDYVTLHADANLVAVLESKKEKEV